MLFSDLRQLFYHQYAQTRSNEICGIQMDEEGYVWLATFHKGVLRSTQPFDVSHTLSFESFDTGIPGLVRSETFLLHFGDGYRKRNRCRIAAAYF